MDLYLSLGAFVISWISIYLEIDDYFQRYNVVNDFIKEMDSVNYCISWNEVDWLIDLNTNEFFECWI
jgi:hypothetical protein